MDAETLVGLDVRWRASWRDLARGLPADLAPHLVVASVAAAWSSAPLVGASLSLRWLGLLVLGTQLLAVLRLLAVRLPAPPGAARTLVLRGASFIVQDGDRREELTAPIAGVLDAGGVVRISFTDGRAVEVPWRAFSNAELRRLRRHLRARMGAPGEPAHVPVHRVGDVPGPGAWRHPALALAVAGALAALPWLLPVAGS